MRSRIDGDMIYGSGECKLVANVRFSKMSELDEFIAFAGKLCLTGM